MNPIVYLNTQRDRECPKGNDLKGMTKREGEVCNIYRVIPLPVRVQPVPYPLAIYGSCLISNPRKPVTPPEVSRIGMDRHLSNVDRCHGKGHLRLVAPNCEGPVKTIDDREGKLSPPPPLERPGPPRPYPRVSRFPRMYTGTPPTHSSLFVVRPSDSIGRSPKKNMTHVGFLDA